ncbi:hypothetical protein [Pseudarthrobacter sp. BIM B-2242]|uniref:hypothetical protein n=1 Tax=Pseudarthrobacter sp. BIM B-2242 TaxID=2772401 RepID=UPI00168BCA65|nr:hypothetical protein [Pseudarthrobacter sp. BIM B-2242]QOD04977.1 hypothetical protein IDT60_08200 [Pseudarthrobacter sp. BIM B-2242]
MTNQKDIRRDPFLERLVRCVLPASEVPEAFLQSGCKKYSKTALKQGIATITDTDGSLIDLATHIEIERRA